MEPRTKKIVTVIDQGRGAGRTGSISRNKVTLTET